MESRASRQCAGVYPLNVLGLFFNHSSAASLWPPQPFPPLINRNGRQTSAELASPPKGG